MSRTDVHAPYWTWAKWWEPVHLRCPYDRWAGKLPRSACDLPSEPKLVDPRNLRKDHRDRGRHCCWEPVWLSWRKARWLHQHHVPKWFVDHRWNNVERTRERDRLGRMAKEYNANGDLNDGDFPNWQPRHGARWDWD
jgi:hypothetical protein